MNKPVFAIVLAVACATSGPASAEVPDRCRVMDPTGTPLNLRASPAGRIIGTLPNGRLVHYLDSEDDSKGQTWARIGDWRGGPTPRARGWVLREFITCF